MLHAFDAADRTAQSGYLARRAILLTERFAIDAGSFMADRMLQQHDGYAYLMACSEAALESGQPHAIPSAPKGEEGRL